MRWDYLPLDINLAFPVLGKIILKIIIIIIIIVIIIIIIIIITMFVYFLRTFIWFIPSSTSEPQICQSCEVKFELYCIFGIKCIKKLKTKLHW